MKYETVILEKEKGIAILTFNRPQVMNAQNFQALEEFDAVMQEIREDDKVRVLIITGAGRGFHAGDDVKELFLGADRRVGWAGRRLGILKDMDRAWMIFPYACHKPTIAAVNGPAVGAGLDIALTCDIRLASENAKFGYFFVRRGLMGSEMGVMILTHLIGVSRALEMMLSGELMDATEAEKIGLVSRVVPQDRLMDEAMKLAHKLMKGAPIAQQVIKNAVYKAMFDPTSLPGWADFASVALMQTEDHLEGARAFLEKREPVYKGK